MKRKTLKTMLGCLTLALTCSIAVGVGAAVSAYAAEVDANTLDTAFSSLTLVGGASVRFNTDKKGNGISYILSMPKTDYETVMGENSAYNNVKFGILVAPNDYYLAHPFNNQADINAYYSLNEKVEGKAFLYDLNSTVMKEWTNDAYDANNVYFRGSIVNIKDENITLDFRGIGYVEYTVDGQTEKHFLTTNDETHVRSMAYVAEQAVKAGKDTDRTLQKTYLNKIADPFATAINGGTANVYNSKTATLDLSVDALSKIQNNTYYKEKYSYAWTLTGADGTVSVENGASLNGRVGTYTLACTATKTSTSETKEVYSQTLNITDLGTVTVNDEELTGVKGMLVKTADGTYKNEYNTNENVVLYYTDKKANGNFRLDVEIPVVGDKAPERYNNSGGTVGSVPGIVLSCGNGKEISIFTNKPSSHAATRDSAAVLQFRVGTASDGALFTSTYFPTVNDNLGVLGAAIKFSVEKVNNTFAFYNRNGSKVFTVNSDGTYTMNVTAATITGKGSDNAAKEAAVKAVMERFAAMLATKETAVGIYREANWKGSYEWKVALSELPELGNPTVNGETLTSAKGTLIKTESGTYKNDNDVNEDIVQYYTQKTQNGNFKLNVEITTISGADNSVGGGGDRGAEVGIVLASGNGLEISVFSKKAYLEQTQLCLRVGTNGTTQIAITGFSVSNVSAGSSFASADSKLKFSVERKDNAFIFYNEAGEQVFKVNSDGTIATIKEGVAITKCGDKNTAPTTENIDAVQTRFAEMLAKGDETAFGIYRKAHNKGAYDWNVSLAQ